MIGKRDHCFEAVPKNSQLHIISMVLWLSVIWEWATGYDLFSFRLTDTFRVDTTCRS